MDDYCTWCEDYALGLDPEPCQIHSPCCDDCSICAEVEE